MTEEMNPWEGFVFLFAPGIILLFSLIWLMFDWPAILRELCTKRWVYKTTRKNSVWTSIETHGHQMLFYMILDQTYNYLGSAGLLLVPVSITTNNIWWPRVPFEIQAKNRNFNERASIFKNLWYRYSVKYQKKNQWNIIQIIEQVAKRRSQSFAKQKYSRLFSINLMQMLNHCSKYHSDRQKCR